jgi:predicted DNA-binding protein
MSGVISGGEMVGPSKHLLEREAEIFPPTRQSAKRQVTGGEKVMRTLGYFVPEVALVTNSLSFVLTHHWWSLALCVCPVIWMTVQFRTRPRVLPRVADKMRIRELQVWNQKWNEIYESSGDDLRAEKVADSEVLRMRKRETKATPPTTLTAAYSRKARTKRLDKFCSICSGTGAYYVRGDDRYCQPCANDVRRMDDLDRLTGYPKATYVQEGAVPPPVSLREIYISLTAVAAALQIRRGQLDEWLTNAQLPGYDRRNQLVKKWVACALLPEQSALQRKLRNELTTSELQALERLQENLRRRPGVIAAVPRSPSLPNSYAARPASGNLRTG